MNTRGHLYVGTSGWAYSWKKLYGVSPWKKHLVLYSKVFSTVEVNATFYHLPEAATYRHWAQETPANFVLGLKLNRGMTRYKRLRGVRQDFRTFMLGAKHLGSKLQFLLIQLPPSFTLQPRRLSSFLRMTREELANTSLPHVRLAFEFRHASWFQPAGLKSIEPIMRRYNAAVVFGHSTRYVYPVTEPVFADFVYLRFHGPRELYASRYGLAGLRHWIGPSKRWLTEGKDVYAYFDNDNKEYAPRDAQDFRRLVSK